MRTRISAALVAAAAVVALAGCSSTPPATSIDDAGSSSQSWKVGDDIAAGAWRNSVPRPGQTCAWWTDTQQGGSGDSRVVVLAEGDTFHSVGCGQWVKA